jgi:hypothetical protein
MEKSDEASYNDSLVKKLDLEYSKVDEFDTYSYTKNDKNLNKTKKKSKFSLFKKQETNSTFNKTRVTNNRHVYNYSHSQASNYTHSLQRHHHNSKTRLDGLDKLKKSISFTKSHEDASFSASSYSNNSNGKEQLEPLVLNNYSSLVNSNGLLTTAISLNNNKNKNGKKHSSKTSSSQSPSPSPSSPSSSLNSLNESPSSKMIGFYNSKTNISKNKNNVSNGNNCNNNTSNVNVGENSYKRGGVVQKPIGFLNSNVSNVNGSEKSTLINNSITTLNTNNITNTTVTTTASSSSSTSSGMCINNLKSII